MHVKRNSTYVSRRGTFVSCIDQKLLQVGLAFRLGLEQIGLVGSRHPSLGKVFLGHTPRPIKIMESTL